MVAPLASAEPPQKVFETNCSACHAVDQKLVGPSLIEIAGIYGKDQKGFLAWCMKPGHKRPDAIEMPSMAHLGTPTLTELHAWILKTTSGKKEKATKGEFIEPPPKDGPQIQRIFLPDSSPAAIAVALPGKISYCFDAAECRLRYVWTGGFIDGAPYWKGNGSSQATITGNVVYRETTAAIGTGKSPTSAAPKFLGYSVKDGLPTFRYVREGVRYTETIHALSDGSGIEREFTTDASVPLTLTPPARGTLQSSTGGLTVPADHAKSFTLTSRWK
ncbi:c-type cytochrome [Luteolibacter sp. LG18]|uniref:c-type cytochrome n=1 Tax=Luteolibacter sp. LG18 TaxID=2819286 RepID=UPI002B2BCB26|nr:hypothetical protein llg_05210 [Luteolibacter sp. LG18]